MMVRAETPHCKSHSRKGWGKNTLFTITIPAWQFSPHLLRRAQLNKTGGGLDRGESIQPSADIVAQGHSKRCKVRAKGAGGDNIPVEETRRLQSRSRKGWGKDTCD